MVEEKSQNLRMPKEPVTRKPPIAFGPQQEGKSPAEAKEIIEGRQKPSKVYRPSKKRNLNQENGGTQ